MSNLYPIPQNYDQWAGYVGPVTVGQSEYGMHKIGTAVASVGATLAATAAFALHGAESPVGLNIDASWHETTSVVEDSNTQLTHKPAVPQWAEAVQKGTHSVLTTETKTLENLSLMPDVTSFDLNQLPRGSSTILNRAAMTGFVMDIKRNQADGWVVDEVERDSESSDETKLDAQRGMDRLDRGNAKLAEQYGQLGDQELGKELAQQEVQLPGATYVKTSHEAVLDAGQLQRFEADVNKLGFKSVADFIDAYKKDPASLSDAARNVGFVYLDAHRNARHIARLSRTVVEQVPAYEETEATRCIDERVINLTTREYVVKYGGNLPIVPIFLPVIRRRRKEDFLDGPFADLTPSALAGTDAQPSVVDGEVVQSDAATDATEANGAVGPDGGQTEDLPAWAVRVNTRRTPVRRPRLAEPELQDGSVQEPAPKPIWEMNPTEFSAYLVARRRAQFKGGAIAGLSMFALLSCLRLDAGYCPDPQNWEHQDWSISHPFPDSLHIGLGLPFFIPGPETAKIEIMPAVCPEDRSTPPYSDGGNGSGSGTSEPTCDTKETTVVNGKVTKVDETHYSGAITITKTER